MRVWAIKPGELKPLSRSGLLLLAARPPGAEAPWSDGLEHLARAASGERAGATALARELRSRGARACDQLAASDEPLGRCMNYATSALSAGVEAVALDARPALVKAVIDAAKMTGSIAGVLAHAGRVPASMGVDPVELACTTTWSAIRADIAVVAAARTSLGSVRALRELAPLWADGVPTWVPEGDGRR